jgi:hypothetical protein
VEWGVYQVLHNNANVCNASTALTLPAPTLAGFGVTVTCTGYAFPDGNVRSWTIKATACNQPACPNAAGDAGYVERELEVTL